MRQNDKQKEILAQFYSNLAIAFLSFGILTPLFVGIGNSFLFILKFSLALIFAISMLLIALEFVK